MRPAFLTTLTALLLCCHAVSAATPTVSKVKESAKILDDTLRLEHLKKVTGDLGRVLKIDTAVVEKALITQKIKLSDLALAKFISEKLNQPIEELLTTSASTDWEALLKTANVSSKEILEHMENLHSEVAFLMLDFRDKKKK